MQLKINKERKKEKKLLTFLQVLRLQYPSSMMHKRVYDLSTLSSGYLAHISNVNLSDAKIKRQTHILSLYLTFFIKKVFFVIYLPYFCCQSKNNNFLIMIKLFWLSCFGGAGLSRKWGLIFSVGLISKSALCAIHKNVFTKLNVQKMVSLGLKQNENHQVTFWKKGQIFCDRKRKTFQCLYMP